MFSDFFSFLVKTSLNILNLSLLIDVSPNGAKRQTLPVPRSSPQKIHAFSTLLPTHFILRLPLSPSLLLQRFQRLLSPSISSPCLCSNAPQSLFFRQFTSLQEPPFASSSKLYPKPFPFHSKGQKSEEAQAWP